MKIDITDDAHWHALRAKHIGASEVAALANLSPWATAFSLYNVKKGLAPEPEVSDDVLNGLDFESAIATRYAIDNQLELNKVRCYYEADQEPFLGATLDYQFQSHEGKPIAVEVKHVRSHSWRHYGWSPDDDYVPPHIEMQLIAQMLATGWEEGRIVAFCDGDYFSFTRSMAEEEKVQIIATDILLLVRKMKGMIDAGTPPDAFGEPFELKMLALLAPSDKEKPRLDLRHDAAADEMLAQLHYWQGTSYQADTEINRLKVKISELLMRHTNDGAVPEEILTAGYTVKRAVSKTKETTIMRKAGTMTRFTVKKIEGGMTPAEPESNPIIAG